MGDFVKEDSVVLDFVMGDFVTGDFVILNFWDYKNLGDFVLRCSSATAAVECLPLSKEGESPSNQIKSKYILSNQFYILPLSTGQHKAIECMLH